MKRGEIFLKNIPFPTDTTENVDPATTFSENNNSIIGRNSKSFTMSRKMNSLNLPTDGETTLQVGSTDIRAPDFATAHVERLPSTDSVSSSGKFAAFFNLQLRSCP